ncbi:NTP transferase domain-containing protein, partial [Agrococcus casei]
MNVSDAYRPSDRGLAVIVLAAGSGTRMKSAIAKPLHALAGLPLIGHVLRTAGQLEPAHTVAVVRHERDQMVEAITSLADGVAIADQDDVPGTGRAVEAGINALPADFDGTVVVLSGDVPLIDAATLRDLIAEHDHSMNAMTVLSTIMAEPKGFGRIIRNRAGSFEAIVEEKDADEAQRKVTEVNGGIYVFSCAELRVALDEIGTDNAQGEKYLTDAALRIQASGGRI